MILNDSQQFTHGVQALWHCLAAAEAELWLRQADVVALHGPGIEVESHTNT